MDDRILMILANLLAITGGFVGIRAARAGGRSRWTIVWMIATFTVQCMVLSVRGEMQGRCPLTDPGEILFFLAWALTLFYLAVGSAYRVTFLGTFSAPVIVALQALAVIPGIYREGPPAPAENIDPWLEAHASLSVLAYGALALSAIASVMFLVQNKRIKQRNLDPLAQKMPSVRMLGTAGQRLVWLGFGILTMGLACGFLTPATDSSFKLIYACAVWACYAGLILVALIRGLTAKRFALSAISLFALSLLVFAF